MGADLDRFMAKRMYFVAMACLAAAIRLTTAADPRPSSAEPFLTVLAMEILMKAVWRVSKGDRPRFGHRYAEGWDGLDAAVRGTVLDRAGQRYPGRADLDELSRFLPGWEAEFTKGRYGHEPRPPMTEEDLFHGRPPREAGKEGVRDMDVVRDYTKSALVHGLRRWLEDRLGVSGDVPI